MARTLNSITIVTPSSDPDIALDGNFDFEVSLGYSGGGSWNTYDIKFEFDDSGVGTNWQTIGGATDLSTSATNPLTGQSNGANVLMNIVGNTAAVYDIRAVGDPDTGNDSYTVISATQQVSVGQGSGTINEKTLQDLNSIAVSDNSPPERERYRETLDDADLSYSAQTLHKRTVEILDSWLGLIDAITATKSAAPQGGTFTDTITATDAAIELRLRARALLDTLDALDAALAYRESYRLATDALAVADAAERFTERSRSATDTIAATDTEIALRERTRELISTLAASDSAQATIELRRLLSDALGAADSAEALRERYRVLSEAIAVEDYALIPEIGTILSDTLAAIDAQFMLRQRFRLLLDSVAVEDDAIATYYGGAGAIYNKTLPNALAMLDALAMLRERTRELADSIDLSDATKQAIERQQLTLDNFNLSDAAIQRMHRYRVLTENIALTDAAIAAAEGIISRQLSDTLAAVDSITPLRLFERELQDFATSTQILDEAFPERLRDRYPSGAHRYELAAPSRSPARCNLLKYSNDFSQSAWVKQTNVNITPGKSDPDGGSNATEIDWTSAALNNGIYQPGANANENRFGDMFTHAVYIRASGAVGNGEVTLTDPNASNEFTTLVLTSNWQRLSHSAIALSANGAHGSWLRKASGGPDVIEIYQWQLHPGHEVGDYVETTDAPIIDYTVDSIIPLTIRPRKATEDFAASDAIDQFIDRQRALSDAIALGDDLVVTYLPGGILTYYRTLSEALAASDTAIGFHIYPLIDFIIRHNVTTMAIDHDVERRFIRHGIERET